MDAALKYNATDATLLQVSQTMTVHGNTSAAWSRQGDIVKMYVGKGLSMRKIAAKVGVSRQTVCKVLKDAGIKATQRGPKPAPRMAIDYEGDILRMYVNEITPITVIAKRLKLSVKDVSALLHSNSVEVKRGAMRSIIFPELRNLEIGESLILPRIGLTKRQTYIRIYGMAKSAGIRVSVRAIDESKVKVTRKA